MSKCPTCGFSTRPSPIDFMPHRCPPRWRVSWMDGGELEQHEVHEFNAASAGKRAVELHEADGGAEGLRVGIGQGHQDVKVEPIGSASAQGPGGFFRIHGESIATYYPTPIEEDQFGK